MQVRISVMVLGVKSNVLKWNRGIESGKNIFIALCFFVHYSQKNLVKLGIKKDKNDFKKGWSVKGLKVFLWYRYRTDFKRIMIK